MKTGTRLFDFVTAETFEIYTGNEISVKTNKRKWRDLEFHPVKLISYLNRKIVGEQYGYLLRGESKRRYRFMFHTYNLLKFVPKMKILLDEIKQRKNK